MSCAPGGRLQSVPVLRRPSQGLRFSRQTRRRAPEAGSSGGDNPDAAETWARLLLLKIGPAVFWAAAWRRNMELVWLLVRVDQHLPPPIHMCDFGAGRVRVFHGGALVARRPGSWGTVWGGRFVSAITPLQPAGFGQPARVLLGELVGGRFGAVSVPKRVLLSLDLNGQACVARPGRVPRSWRAVGTFSLVTCTVWAIAGG